MRVTIVSDAYYPIIDGVVRFVDQLGYAFTNAGHHVTMVVPTTHGMEKFDYSSRPFNFLKLPTFPVAIEKYFLCFPSEKLQQTIHQSDLIIVNSLAFTTAYALLFNKRRKAPVVHFVHADERQIFEVAVSLPKGISSKILQFLKYMTSQMDYFAVATNKFHKRTLEFGVSENQIFRVPFGYSKRSINKSKMREFKDSLGIKDGNQVLLYFGRLSDEKNIDVVVEVMKKLKYRNQNIVMIVAGDGSRYKQLKQHIKKEKLDIQLLGRVKDSELPYIYSVADVFFSPSYHEALGFTTVEAMSYGAAPALNGQWVEKELNSSNYIPISDITDVPSIVNLLEGVFSENQKLNNIKQEARKTAKQFTWQRFADIWIRKSQDILQAM